MKLTEHTWNGSAIAQLTEDTKISKYFVPRGYVNATQMCQACGKRWNHYASLDSTKSYWEALSLDTGISASNLVFSIRGRADKINQGTWVHPEVAIDLAQWVSVEFRIWANRTLRQVMTGTQIKVEPEPVESKPTCEEIAQIIDLTLGKTDLNPKLIAGVKLNAIAKIEPKYAIAAEEAKSLLVVETEAELLTATKLAEILSERTGSKLTARQINKILIEQGFQNVNAEGNPSYLPTSKGKEFSQLILNTAKGRDKTVQQLRWHREVLEAIESPPSDPKV